MKLYFLRHGESKANARGQISGQYDSPLTPKGENQAAKASSRVKKLEVNVIYVSTLKRARRTAEIVVNKAGLNKNMLHFDDRIIERSVGALERVSIAVSGYRASTAPDDTPGAESISELRARAQDFLDDIRQKHDKDTVLIVSHGACIKMMVSILTGRDWYSIREIILPHATPFRDLNNDA